MFSNEKGQAFEPFKMLIGAIIALLILVIIMTSISYFENLEDTISHNKLYRGFVNAVNQPNGSVLLIRNLQFKEGYLYTNNGIGETMGIDSSCVEFIDNDISSVTVSSESVRINDGMIANVYVRCNVSFDYDCEIICEISFVEDFSD